MKPTIPHSTKPRRHHHDRGADTASVRAWIPEPIAKVLARLADETGLTREQLTVLLIGPEPDEKLRQILDARRALLAQRRDELLLSAEGGD